MSDLRTVYSGFLEGADLALDGTGLAQDPGLETAVILSLFTDRRAADDDALPGGVGADRRGWWGDVVPLAEGIALGSRLWLLAREKETAVVLARAQFYAEEALAWLVTTGVAARLSVAASAPRRGLLRLDIQIERPGQAATTYDFAWDAMTEDLHHAV